MDFRHELKHEIALCDAMVIRSRLNAIAKIDQHAIDGKYLVRSLYFDNIADKALREKIDGVNCREKFRIRYYNGDTSFIHIEKKSKINGLCNKQLSEVTEDEVSRLLEGDMDWMMAKDDPLITELYSKMRSQGIRPKTIIDYTRDAFTYPAGNVRVTIDYDIRTSLQYERFFDAEYMGIPLWHDPIILEVKWDRFLPEIIKGAVGTQNTRAAAFSKYAAGRIYG